MSSSSSGLTILGLPVSTEKTDLLSYLTQLVVGNKDDGTKFTISKLEKHRKSSSALVSLGTTLHRSILVQYVHAILQKPFQGIYVNVDAHRTMPVLMSPSSTTDSTKKDPDKDLVAELSTSFHNHVLRDPIILQQASSSREGLRTSFQTFLSSRKDLYNPTKITKSKRRRRKRRLEALVVSQLLKRRVLKSKRHGDVVVLAFADTTGTFPLAQVAKPTNNNGVTVSHAVVDPQGEPPLTAKPIVFPKGKTSTFHLNITTTKEELDVSCLSVKFLKVLHAKQFRIVEPRAFPMTLNEQKQVPIEVTVPPQRIGILRVGIRFSFQSTENNEKTTFTILRWIKVKGESTHAAMEDVLRATTPYQRRKNTPRQEMPQTIMDPPKQKSASEGENPFKHLPQHWVPAGVASMLQADEFINAFEPWPPQQAVEDDDDDVDSETGSVIVETPEDAVIGKYSKFWRDLLWCSEHQMKQDIQLFDMSNASLRREGNQFVLKVPGLAEGRPSVLRGDMVHVTWNNFLYKGRVGHVRLEEIVLEFHASFRQKFNPAVDRVNVRFTFSRMSYRIMHEACSTAESSLGETMLLPSEPLKSPNPRKQHAKPLRWANRSLNKEQYLAVDKIVSGDLRPLPYIIFGPPGTGKTTTVVETVYQLAKHADKMNILVVTPSNDAANILVERLSQYFPPSELRRILAYTRGIETLPESIHAYASSDNQNQLSEILSAQIIVCTVSMASKFSYQGVPKGHFDVMCLDEAGHATEPEVIATAATLMDFFPANGERIGQLVLAGDPKQLGPVISSPVGMKFGLGVSYMERLTNLDLYKHNEEGIYPDQLLTKLVRNYRSHPAILKVPNELFYESELQTCGDKMMTHNMANWEHLPRKGFPVVFHAMEGENLREATSPSWFNPQEAEQVVAYVNLLLKETKPPLSAEEIGIITPYARQAQKIRKALATLDILNVKVGTVDIFQGQERRCIIVSTVRAEESQISTDLRYNLGFVANPKRFNVAVTRAKSLLIVIGCPRILAMDKIHWRPFLEYCHENESWCGEEWDPNEALSEDEEKKDDDDENDWDVVASSGISQAVEQGAVSVVFSEE